MIQIRLDQHEQFYLIFLCVLVVTCTLTCYLYGKWLYTRGPINYNVLPHDEVNFSFCTLQTRYLNALTSLYEALLDFYLFMPDFFYTFFLYKDIVMNEQ